MDASRLLAVLDDIATDYATGFKTLLAAFVQAYTQARDNPTQDLTAQIDVAYAKLAADLRGGLTNDYPPSRVRILSAIAGTRLVGEGALRSVDAIISSSGRTPAGLVTALGVFVQEVAEFHKACAQTAAGLQQLGLEPQALAAGEFEIGVLIPDTITDSELGALVKQLRLWNTALRGFAEVAGEDSPEVKVRDLSSGSLEAYLAVGAFTAALVARVVDKVLEWYQRILDIQVKRKELAALGAPVAEAKQVEQFEKKYIDDSIAALVKELMADTKLKVSAERRGELQNHLTISIRHFVKFVDKGGDVEVTAGRPQLPEVAVAPPQDAPQDQQEAYVAAQKEFERLDAIDDEALRVSRQGAGLRQLPTRVQPILQLTEGEDDEGDDTDDKKPKKKAP